MSRQFRAHPVGGFTEGRMEHDGAAMDCYTKACAKGWKGKRNVVSDCISTGSMAAGWEP